MNHKYSIVLCKSSGVVGIADLEVSAKRNKLMIMYDIEPIPSYRTVRKSDAIVLGWVPTNSIFDAFRKIPRTFHELSIEARINLGFLSAGSKASYYTDRGITESRGNVGPVRRDSDRLTSSIGEVPNRPDNRTLVFNREGFKK